MPETFIAACVQMRSGRDPAANRDAAVAGVREAASRGAELRGALLEHVFIAAASLLLASLVAGVGGGLFDAPKNAALTEVTRPEHRTRMFSLMSIFGNLGMVTGPLIGAALMGLGKPPAPENADPFLLSPPASRT